MFNLLPFFGKKKTKEELEISQFIQRKFGYSIKNYFYFKRALTHKSIANKSGEISNERLEFLGDAILDSVIAEYLFIKFPDEDEGYLTKIKSKIVSRRTLGKIANEMELSLLMRYNKNRSIKIETIEGNAFEALIGAIYLDGGYSTTKKCINNHVFRKYVNFNQILEEEIDIKSKLYIWGQKNRVPIEFSVIKEENNRSTWHYVVVALVNTKEFGMGSGSSKKIAEQVAAKETMELLGEE